MMRLRAFSKPCRAFFKVKRGITTTSSDSSSRVHRPISSIPGPLCVPLLGNLPYYTLGLYDRHQYQKVLLHLYNTYGPIVRQRLGLDKTIVHVFMPDDIQKVYRNEGKWPEVPPLQETTQLYRAQKAMSLGLGNTNGEEWYRLRTHSQQKMLRPNEVQKHLPGVNSVANDLVGRLRRKAVLGRTDVHDLRLDVALWSMENAAKVAFNIRPGFMEANEELGSQLVEANDTIFKLSGELKLSFPLYRFFSTPKWLKLVEAENLFYTHATTMAEEAIKKFQVSSPNERSHFHLLSHLLSQSELSRKDVVILCLSVFADGLSTTTPTLLFALQAIASRRSLQLRLQREVDAVVIDESTEISSQHVSKMPLLKACVKETFRMWPNGTEVSRFLPNDLEIQGFVLPKGTHVDINATVHFRDPTIFPRPNTFAPGSTQNPIKHSLMNALKTITHNINSCTNFGHILLIFGSKDRWLGNHRFVDGDEELEQPKLHPFLFTPFGHGTRMCAGRRFAEQDLHVLLARLVRSFSLEAVESEIGQRYQTLLVPDRGVRIRFVPRDCQL